MIVVAGSMEFPASDMDRARQAALVVMRESALEQGCLVYRFAADLEQPNVLRFYEEWASAEALESHRHSPHNQEFRQALSELGMTSRVVRKFAVTPAEIL